jgi:hypothetical protein
MSQSPSIRELDGNIEVTQLSGFGLKSGLAPPVTLPLPKTPSALVRAGAGVSEMLARLLGAGPGRSW